MYDSLSLIMWVLMVWLIVSFFMTMRSRRKSTTDASQTDTQTQTASTTQMVEDIKSTKTSRIVDQLEIVDELSATTSNYRQYCELVGTSMREGGVVAPYSGREVAYYDVKCFRIDYVGTQTRETLVAHETSIDPFYFTDDSCDTPVYVDLKSFGNNVILVNSTNHVEGPNSDFSKAFQKNASPSGTSQAMAFAALPYVSMGNFLANKLSDLLHDATRVLRGPVFRPAYAYAGAVELPSALEQDEHPHVLFAQRKGNQPGGRGRGSMGAFGMGPMPPGMGEFLGGGIYGVPMTRYRRTDTSDVGSVLVGMTLSALLRSMSQTTTTQSQHTTTGGSSNSGFGGYRIVEDVVPLGSPTYCIGELYRQGTDAYIGRSVAKDYTTSFFATRPEAEVLSALGA